MRQIFALLSAQGTACAETVLTADEFTEDNRRKVEAECCGNPNSYPGDPPLAGTWTDVTENDACQSGA